LETLLKVYYTANVGPPSKTTVQFNRISFHNANSCNLISKILFEEFIRGKGERDEKRRRENNKRKKKKVIKKAKRRRHRSDNLIFNHGLTFNGCVYKDHGNRYLWEAIDNLFAYITVFC